ncbi:MAG: hypothetical protein ACO1OQ_01840, partial [Rufibacter sp.]
MATNSIQTKPAQRKGIRVSSRAIAILVSVAVAAIITAYLYFGPQLTFRQMVLALSLTFSACFLLVYFSYEALVFREINNIYAGLEKFKRKEFKQMSTKFPFRPDPLKRIKDEMYPLGERNQKENEELKQKL